MISMLPRDAALRQGHFSIGPESIVVLSAGASVIVPPPVPTVGSVFLFRITSAGSVIQFDTEVHGQ